jgi:hypothetical protein
MTPQPTGLRLREVPDLGDLIRLAVAENPFLPREAVLDRVVVTDRVGLLVGDSSATITLLYLWTHTIDDVSPWMAHAGQWLERYAIWRKAHGLAPSSEAVRMVLAAPGLGEGARSALRLVSCRVTPVRYSYLELSGKAVLAWEWGAEPVKTVTQWNASTTHDPASLEAAAIPELLTSEELAFFRNS